MKPLVLYEKAERYRWRLFLESAQLYLKQILNGFAQLLVMIVHALFVPVTLYKQDCANDVPREVDLRDEYQRFQIPKGPFC